MLVSMRQKRPGYMVFNDVSGDIPLEIYKDERRNGRMNSCMTLESDLEML